MTLPGILLLSALIAVGAALVLVGVRILRKTRNWLFRSLGILAIVVAVVYFTVLAVAIGLHHNPRTPMLVLAIAGVVVSALIFWAGALADCLLNEPNDGMGKLVWMLAIVLTFVAGAAIYYFGQRPRRLRRQNEQRPAEDAGRRNDG